MSLLGKKEKAESEYLKAEVERLRAQLDPNEVALQNRVKALEAQAAALESRIAQSQTHLTGLESQVTSKQEHLRQLQESIVETDEEVLVQSFGFYTPHYTYSTSEEYKQRLADIRAEQKATIKAQRAVTGNNAWTINGDLAQGRKMVADMQKLLLRAFNAECDAAIEHVRFNNIEACRKKIESSADAVSKLGRMLGIVITGEYRRLKDVELCLMYEYQQKKQAEKEEAKELRAQQREEAKVAKELEEQRKKLEKEQNHYKNAYAALLKQLSTADEQQKFALEEKKLELEQQLAAIDKEFQDVDYRAANQKAGYVYIISNVGAFGENVYKIGMTRRLDPMDRVDELGDASVPFDFDVHALIFSDDAPKLEAALHNAFADKKVNFVNQRREFFQVTLEEIKQVIRENYDKTVEFVDVPAAEQYRQSLKLRQNIG